MKDDLVYIIILNWNGWKDTAECVESCLKLSYADFRVLIVDNGSTDRSEPLLRERFPDIELVQTGANLGFSGGNNAGIRYALDHGAAYVWLLNNDTVVAPDALTALVAAARREPKAGMLGSKIYYFNDPDRLWFAGGWINYRIARTGHTGSGETDAGQYDTLREVDYLTGCSLLVPRDVIESVGLMDERFFLLFEETDWNERARRSGRKILYVPASKVRHKVSRSLENDWTGYYYYLTRNSLLFTAKHKPVFLATAVAARVLEAGLTAVRGKGGTAFSMLRGIFDFCRRRFGGLNASRSREAGAGGAAAGAGARQNMKCAIVEYNWVHAETLPTLVHILNTLGAEVDLFASRRIMKNDPFIYTPGLRYRAGDSHGLRFKTRVESRGFADYDFVVFNSIEPKRRLRRARGAKVPLLAVMHNGGLIAGDPEYARFFQDRRRAPLVLAGPVSRSLSAGFTVPWIAPVLVADIPTASPGSNGPVRFCVQGNLAFERRNYAALLDAVEELAKDGREGFVVSLIGRYRPDGRSFHSRAAKRGLGRFFEYSEQGISRYFEYMGRGLSYREYYRLLGRAHFILPLIDRTSPLYASYYGEKVTSSLSVSIGMGLVPVIDAELAALYGVEETCVSYEKGALAEAMKRAMDLAPDEYAARKQGLAGTRERLLAVSADNLAAAVARVTRNGGVKECRP